MRILIKEKNFDSFVSLSNLLFADALCYVESRICPLVEQILQARENKSNFTESPENFLVKLMVVRLV